jgi:hypothetical protein
LITNPGIDREQCAEKNAHRERERKQDKENNLNIFEFSVFKNQIILTAAK